MLAGNASLKIDQVGIPKDICKVLTKPMVVKSLNYGLAEKLIQNKKVNYVQKRERVIASKFYRAVIDIGNTLHVNLMKGDWVVMNRTHTRYWPSMLRFREGTPRHQNLQDISITLIEMKSTVTFLKILW